MRTTPLLRPDALMVALLAAILALAGPSVLLAQDSVDRPEPIPTPGMDAFRTGYGGAVLFPIVRATGDPFIAANVRLTYSAQRGRSLGTQFGGMYLTRANDWSGVATFGARYNLMHHELRVAPFVELGGGVMGNTSPFAGGTETEASIVPLAGGGLGVTAEYILTPGLTFEANLGHWRFAKIDEDFTGERFTTKGAYRGGTFLGFGVRMSSRDDAWWWRTRPEGAPLPRIAGFLPDATGDEVVPLDGGSVGAIIRAPAGLDAAWLEVDGNLRTMTVEAESDAPHGDAYVAMLHGITLEGGWHTVELRMKDGRGQEAQQQFEVWVAPAAASAPPRVHLLEPSADTPLRSRTTTVRGLVADVDELESVTVNGVPVAFRPARDEDREGADFRFGPSENVYLFHGEIPVEAGENPIAVRATDAFGNRGSESRIVAADIRPERATPQTFARTADDGSGPLIRIEEPTQWAVGGTRGIELAPRTSVRVVGTVRDVAGMGIREVSVNGQRVGVRALDDSGAVARFIAFVPADPSIEQVEIVARTTDGRASISQYPMSVAQAPPETPRTVQRHGQRYAVVVGVSDYVDSRVTPLQFAHRDAQAFHDFLRSQEAGLGGIPSENILLLLNEDATARNMRSGLGTFLERVTEDDVVYVYIAGHGVPNPRRPDDLYLLPHDAEVDDLAGTAIPMSYVNDAIRRLPARHVVLFTDACHSGGVSLGGGMAMRAGSQMNAINELFLQDLESVQGGLAILTASEARQVSLEGTQWGGGHGVFTYYLLRGLRGEADEDGDGIVRLGELMEYVRTKVRQETHNGQIPSIGSQSHDRYLPVSIVTTANGAGNGRAAPQAAPPARQPAPEIPAEPTPDARADAPVVPAPSAAPTLDVDPAPAATGPERAAAPASAVRLESMRFFAFEDRLPSPGQRTYAERFEGESRLIGTELRLRHTTTPPGGAEVQCVYHHPDGSTRSTEAGPLLRSGGGSMYNAGVGWWRAGRWSPGTYRVECTLDGQNVGEGRFEVTGSGPRLIGETRDGR